MLGIDIFWDITHTSDYARRTLATLLGIDVPEHTQHGTPAVVATDELTLRINVSPVGGWAAHSPWTKTLTTASSACRPTLALMIAKKLAEYVMPVQLLQEIAEATT